MSHKRKARAETRQPAETGDSLAKREAAPSLPDSASRATLPAPDRPEPKTTAPAGLFPWPAAELLTAIGKLPALLATTLELKSRHRADLPRAVATLSALLTSERASLGADYLNSPVAMAAYLYYYLPWNLYRLGRMAAGIAPLLAAGRDQATVVDLGAGPLTTPLALWLTLPAWRSRQLDFYCVDRSKRIMSVGRDIFQALTHAEDGTPCPWRIHLVHAPLLQALRKEVPRPDLLVLGNVLNEFRWERGVSLEEQLGALAETMLGRLNAAGQALLVEPGNRLGGTLVALFRSAAIRQGLRPLAPCTHDAVCPRLDRRRKSWCHFTFKPVGLPDWLTRLSDKAGLGKSSLSASFVLLGETASYPAEAIRILSDSFPLPERGAVARYGCARSGLVLLQTQKSQAASCAPGELLQLPIPPDAPRDAKSGAQIIRLGHSFPPTPDHPDMKHVSPASQPVSPPATERRPDIRRPAPQTPTRLSTNRPAPRARFPRDDESDSERIARGAMPGPPRWSKGEQKGKPSTKRMRRANVEPTDRSREQVDATRLKTKRKPPRQGGAERHAWQQQGDARGASKKAASPRSGDSKRNWRKQDSKQTGHGDESLRSSFSRVGARQPGAKGTGRRPWEKGESRRPEDGSRDKRPITKGPPDERRVPEVPGHERKGKAGSRTKDRGHSDESLDSGSRVTKPDQPTARAKARKKKRHPGDMERRR